MTKDMKLGIGFLFICGMVVSGCLGYSIKESEHQDRLQIIAQYNAQQSSCSRMMQQLSEYSSKTIKRKPSPKELAIIRMQRD